MKSFFPDLEEKDIVFQVVWINLLIERRKALIIQGHPPLGD